MTSAFPGNRIDSDAALAAHLDALVDLDPRLMPVRAVAGPVAARKTAPGFAGMARIICGQQLSVASARAIWARFEAIAGATEAESFLMLPEEAIRATGFSSGKYRTLCGLAEAIGAGALDFAAIEALPADAAIAALTRHKGVGPWTAEIYLMFCAGHPDVFPAGDLALRKAVGHALGLDARPSIAEVLGIAASWSPHRAAAALMFWAYHGAIRAREGIML